MGGEADYWDTRPTSHYPLIEIEIEMGYPGSRRDIRLGYWDNSPRRGLGYPKYRPISTHDFDLDTNENTKMMLYKHVNAWYFKDNTHINFTTKENAAPALTGENRNRAHI